MLLWANDRLTNTRHIGTTSKQVKTPRLLIVDGQQRLNCLYAVFKGHKVLTKDFKEVQIQIAFRPADAKFEVADAAIQLDPEYIFNTSQLWSDSIDILEFVDHTKRYL
ncbi:MAG: hypothetical protein V7K55_08125 [Nostoc sp.]|uniref:hypothetical protein n=1 Tax=Nostoc sp. TaxID=1180 RepID=UPI002FF70794